MTRHPSPARPARRAAAIVAGTIAALAAGALLPAHAATSTAPATREVTYQGHHFQVPSAWPVLVLAEAPTTCVRFDQHAVYLGTPGTGQACPAHASGRTESLLVEPVDSATAGQGRHDNTTSHQITATADRIRVTATYGVDKALVSKILTDAALPTNEISPRAPAATSRALNATSTLATNVTSHTGKGFEACTAPSSSAMHAWKTSSPFGAVGIYMGGPTRACSQPNLTASWVQQQASEGWRFMPLYAGLQAPDLPSPAAQGTAAADEAIDEAVALGFPRGSVLYYDMENYNSSTYRSAVLTALSAWTRQLHARGYNSGVYANHSSGIVDLSGAIGSGYTLPDVIYSAYWNHAADTGEPNIPSGAWVNHQRIHQYEGDVSRTYGGVTIAIDEDYLDVNVAPPTPGGADITGNGQADLMVLGIDGSIGLRPGSGTGFGASTTVSSGWQNFLGGPGQGRTYYADINGDGRKDLLVHGTDGNIGVHLNNGSGTSFGGNVPISSGWQNYLGQAGQGRLSFADINGDGKADLIIEGTDGTIATHLGSGTSFGANLPLSSGWQNYLSQPGQGRLSY
ncbi:glycoside hydrolase domain-containing protein, partial [Streptomyces sp. NPDC087917]|uniref:glycoside hydrolase domain-containing protein n=1 Tax=Streptomyces sp. NPDC087917 TaxID=3155060 RepID=UPI0034329BB8